MKKPPRARPSAARVALTLLLVGVVGVTGVCTGIILAKPPSPTALSSAKPVETVPITGRSYDDRRTVEIAVTEAQERTIVAPGDGKITATTCQPGATFTSTDSSYSLDGIPVLNLATAVPLWRDLAVGDKGEDVEALQTELQRIGYNLTPNGVYNQATLGAVRDLLKQAGHPTWKEAQLEQRYVQWLPATTVSVASCAIELGQNVKTDDTVATLPGAVTGAAITVLPQQVAPGERALIIDEQTYDVSDDGTITNAEQLQRLATSPSYLFSKRAESNKINGSFLLAAPIQALIVPPGAITQVQQGSGCVVADGQTKPVNIIGSELGQTFVTFADGSTPTAVQLNPAKDTTC